MPVFKAFQQRSYVWLIKHGQLSYSWQRSTTLRALKTETKHTAAADRQQKARRQKNHSFNKEIK
jgi:hypothetical protein